MLKIASTYKIINERNSNSEDGYSQDVIITIEKRKLPYLDYTLRGNRYGIFKIMIPGEVSEKRLFGRR